MQPYKVLIDSDLLSKFSKYQSDILDCIKIDCFTPHNKIGVTVNNYTQLTVWILCENDLLASEKFEAMRVFNLLYAVTDYN